MQRRALFKILGSMFLHIPIVSRIQAQIKTRATLYTIHYVTSNNITYTGDTLFDNETEAIKYVKKYAKRCNSNIVSIEIRDLFSKVLYTEQCKYSVMLPIQ